MKLEEYIRQQVEKDVENLLTDSDREFCRKLAQDVQKRPAVKQSRRPKIKLWASIGSAVAAVLLAVIIIPFALIKKPADEILYQEENVANTVCSVEDLNNGSSSFEVIQTENSKITVKQFYDTVSNDALYYEVNVTGIISEYSLYVIVNSKYNYKFDLSENLFSVQLSDYSINYSSAIPEESRMEAKYKGVIKLNTETVYIDYGQLVDLGEKAFFDDIQSVLKVKN